MDQRYQTSPEDDIMKEKVQNIQEGRGPVELVYLEEFDTKQEAMSKEAKIKRLTRKEKLLLIENYQQGAKIKSGTLRSYGINFHP